MGRRNVIQQIIVDEKAEQWSTVFEETLMHSRGLGVSTFRFNNIRSSGKMPSSPKDFKVAYYQFDIFEGEATVIVI